MAFMKTWHLHFDLGSTNMSFCLKVRPLKRKQNVRLSYHHSVNKPAATFKNAINLSVVQGGSMAGWFRALDFNSVAPGSNPVVSR